MFARSRVPLLAACGAGSLLLLTSCGGEETGARTTIAEVQDNSFVTQPPATTSTTVAPAPVPVPGDVSTVEQAYTVVRGDSLSRIASIHGIELDALINFNGWTDGISHPINPGETVRVPPNSKIPGAAATADPAATTAPGTEATGTEAEGSSEGCTHTIALNENPTRVAKKYDITVEQLQTANPGGVMDTFIVGETLTIPPGADC